MEDIKNYELHSFGRFSRSYSLYTANRVPFGRYHASNLLVAGLGHGCWFVLGCCVKGVIVTARLHKRASGYF